MSKSAISKKRQKIKSKQQKRPKSPDAKAFEKPVSESREQYIRDLCRDWEDTP